MDEIIAYLIRFLVGEDCARRVAYTADASTFRLYDLVIIPSGFFDNGRYAAERSMPSLPLRQWEGIPILYGHPTMQTDGGSILLYADLIAGAFFLLSRYEEMMRRDLRDRHGRFPGKESLPYRAGFIHRPIIDEYRTALRRLLGKSYTGGGFGSIVLTHDIDAPYLYRSPKGFVRSMLAGRGLRTSLNGLFGPPEADPYYTFPQMQAMSSRLSDMSANVCCRLFFRAGGRTAFDKPHYDPACRDLRRIAAIFAAAKGFEAGLHASYEAGLKPSLIASEKIRLEKALGCSIACNRHHFLAAREPEDMHSLINAGLTHDYTMGYADMAGFRLGTARCVRWIAPDVRQLTDLTLHPLLIMDSTLEEQKYMGLTFEAASASCRMLIDNAHRVGGDVCLLWHNTSMVYGTGSYLRRLYTDLLSYIREK
ncbi:MAG: polysaccharide deacetylase family protein [Tannerellaceae bacterium]|jgi:hypothetical protein|nr:polysaccharide deacetylase family protein [Tannerellaceae bacterium]